MHAAGTDVQTLLRCGRPRRPCISPHLRVTLIVHACCKLHVAGLHHGVTAVSSSVCVVSGRCFRAAAGAAESCAALHCPTTTTRVWGVVPVSATQQVRPELLSSEVYVEEGVDAALSLWLTVRGVTTGV